jgi:hypothetical protein
MIAANAQVQRPKSARSVPLALGWLLWRRVRHDVAVTLLYVAIVSLLVHTFDVNPYLAALMVAPLAFAILKLILGFTSFGAMPMDPDMGSKTTVYPGMLLIAPVRTRSLVFWPMLYGALTMVAVWYAVFWLIIKPEGWSVSAYWPPLLLVALCAWSQAILWAPVAKSLRMAMLFVPDYGIVAFGPLATLSHVSSLTITAAYLAAILPAYPVALSALTRARCGGELAPPRFGNLSVLLGRAFSTIFGMALPKKPFASVRQAQSWFEWRAYGWLMPALSFGLVLFMTIMGVSEQVIMMHSFPGFGDGMPIQLAFMPPGIKAVGVLSMWLPLAPQFFVMATMVTAATKSDFSLFAGQKRQLLDGSARRIPLSSWTATKPMSSAGLVAAKLDTAAGAAIATMIAISPFMLMWLLAPCKDGATSGPLVVLLAKYVTPTILARIVLVLVAFVYLAWKAQADILFAKHSGSAPLRLLYWLVLYMFGALCFICVNPSMARAFHLPYYDGFRRDVLLALPAIIAAGVTSKFIALSVIVQALLQRRLIDLGAIRRIATAWFAAATIVSAVAVIVTPASFAAPWLVVATVALLMPGARMTLAPLVLASNRHR